MNTGKNKKSKSMDEINPQLGINQIVQHFAKVILSKSFKGKRPTKEEFFEHIWNEMQLLITDLSNWMELEGEKKTIKIKTKTKSNELENIGFDDLID